MNRRAQNPPPLRARLAAAAAALLLAVLIALANWFPGDETLRHPPSPRLFRPRSRPPRLRRSADAAARAPGR